MLNIYGIKNKNKNENENINKNENKNENKNIYENQSGIKEIEMKVYDLFFKKYYMVTDKHRVVRYKLI